MFRCRYHTFLLSFAHFFVRLFAGGNAVIEVLPVMVGIIRTM